MSFLQELKKRQVFKVGAANAIVDRFDVIANWIDQLPQLGSGSLQ